MLADISGMLDSYMDASVQLLRATVKEVIALPKPQPLPAPKMAPPAPPPPRPAKPSAPSPPPPPGWDVCIFTIKTTHTCACWTGTDTLQQDSSVHSCKDLVILSLALHVSQIEA